MHVHVHVCARADVCTRAGMCTRVNASRAHARAVRVRNRSPTHTHTCNPRRRYARVFPVPVGATRRADGGTEPVASVARSVCSAAAWIEVGDAESPRSPSSLPRRKGGTSGHERKSGEAGGEGGAGWACSDSPAAAWDGGRREVCR